MRYRFDPDRPDEPVIEATPREIDAYREYLRAYLRKWSALDLDDIEDVAQKTLLIILRIITSGAVRGDYQSSIEGRVKALVTKVARNVAINEIRFRSREANYIVKGIELFDLAADRTRDPEGHAIAMQLYDRMQAGASRYVEVLFLSLLADPLDVARDEGLMLRSVYSMKNEGRNELAKKIGYDRPKRVTRHDKDPAPSKPPKRKRRRKKG